MDRLTSDRKTVLESKISLSAVDGRGALVMLIEATGATLDTITGAQYQALADRLSVVAGGGKTKERAWTRSYLHGVAHGKIEPSQRLTHAVAAMLAEAGGASPLRTRGHPVQVIVLGNVAPGTIIFGDGRPCGNPYCDIKFLPRTWNHKFCCPDCKRKAKELA